MIIIISLIFKKLGSFELDPVRPVIFSTVNWLGKSPVLVEVIYIFLFTSTDVDADHANTQRAKYGPNI